MVTRGHMPLRMCAICRQRFPKAQLLRHTRSEQGEWQADEKQRQAGRGVYLCPDPDCRKRFAAFKGGKKQGHRAKAGPTTPQGPDQPSGKRCIKRCAA